MFDTASCEWFLAKLDPYGTYNQQILDPIIPLQLLDVFNEIPQITWVKSGVLQGAVLAPLLFLLFINNFPDQAFPIVQQYISLPILSLTTWRISYRYKYQKGYF